MAQDLNNVIGRGLALHQQGLLSQAKVAYEQALALFPNHFDALHMLGVIAAQSGDKDLALELLNRAVAAQANSAPAYANRGKVLKELHRLNEAIVDFDKALALQPDFVDAHLQRALVLRELQRTEEALAGLDKVISLRPDLAAAHYSRGNALRDIGKLTEAADSFGRAISLAQDFLAAYNNRAAVLQVLNRLDEAVADLDRAIEINPGLVAVQLNRANVLQALARYSEAVVGFDRVIALSPGLADAHSNRGAALHALGRLEEALNSLDTAINIQPTHAAAHNNRGLVLTALKRQTQAIASFDKALVLDPGYAEAHNNRGIALRELQQYEDALASFERAIAVRPDFAGAHYNRGNVLGELQRFAEAQASFDKALAIQPEHAEAQWNKALALLMEGRLEEGWPLYESRWRQHGVAQARRPFTQPLWMGQESLAGKTILLHAEQGLGDTLQFCRYAEPVHALGARVVLEVQKPLVGLVRTLRGVDAVIERGQPLPAFDFHCPLLSLPLAFQTRLDTIPSGSQPYLVANAEKRLAWSQRLGAKAKPRIGVVWSSASTFVDDAGRSMRLDEFVRCLPFSEVEVVCLQKVIKPEDQAFFDTYAGISFFGDELGDFSDTAALASCMDLVISTCTSVPHMAGALGIPTWILLKYVPDWRWLLGREESPWYSSVKLYRQVEDRLWESVLERVRLDLGREGGWRPKI